jgi:hypothetical protein
MTKSWNLSDKLYKNTRKYWPLWVVIGSVKYSAGNFVARSTEVHAKYATDAALQAHAKFNDASGVTFVEIIYGPYRKDE